MLISNATLVTWETPNRVPPNHALLIEGGHIRKIGTSAALLAKYPSEEALDARGQLGMPGNICAHTHFYSPNAMDGSLDLIEQTVERAGYAPVSVRYTRNTQHLSHNS
jgi:cytosine/adenosine deaminase-related metal-dependent hydrolase